MDLVAGDKIAILTAIATDDLAACSDRTHLTAHLSLGAGLDPTWLDRFSKAARTVTDSNEPCDFLDARRKLDGSDDALGDRLVERVDGHWIAAIARLSDHDLLAVTGRWLDLLDQTYGALPREEKPWIRELAGEVVQFCRAAERAPDVIFVRSR
jgi:hypothetical protein